MHELAVIVVILAAAVVIASLPGFVRRIDGRGPGPGCA